MVELNFMILEEEENANMSGNDYAKQILVEEIRYRYRLSKNKSEEK